MTTGLAELRDQARSLALQGGMNIDRDVYLGCGRDPIEPLIGGGNHQATYGFLGRDPGRHEVLHFEPLIGAGGQLVRTGVHRAERGCEPADFQGSLEVNQWTFFSNTVPYKPVGNKAWSMGIKRRFFPVIASCLVDHWVGADLLTLGNVAFHWFGIDQSPEVRERLATFWDREDRYEQSLETPLASPVTGQVKVFRLHPLPHPSPLNARWYKAFPSLLDARLASVCGRR